MRLRRTDDGVSEAELERWPATKWSVMDESGCVFCRIVEGRAPAHVVWRDAEHVAFLDSHPITAGAAEGLRAAIAAVAG